VSADQVVQMVGTLLILAGFILSQRNLLHADSSLYLVLNLTGATILAVLAFQGQRWGFVLLEGVWALVALVGLIVRLVERSRLRRRPDRNRRLGTQRLRAGMRLRGIPWNGDRTPNLKPASQTLRVARLMHGGPDDVSE